MAIVLRSTKDSALTFAEMDGNFTDLDTRVSAIDSAFIKNIAGTKVIFDSHEDWPMMESVQNWFIGKYYERKQNKLIGKVDFLEKT